MFFFNKVLVVGIFLEEMRKHLADPGMGIQSNIDNLEKTKQQMAVKDPNSPAIARLDAQIDSLKIQIMSSSYPKVFEPSYRRLQHF